VTQDTTAELEQLRQRLARIETTEAIKALKHRYWRACDGKNPQGFRDCFIAKGASIDFGALGRFDDADPIAEVFESIALQKVDGKPVILDMHHGVLPDITITSDTTATGVWTLRFRQVNLINNTETVSTGEYDDEYVIEDGVWKMSKCHFHPGWSITRPITADTVVAVD